MRTLGFLGLFFLAIVNVIGLYLAVREHDWKGIAQMPFFMVGLLLFFSRKLWRGARLSRQTNSGEKNSWRLGWRVGRFVFRNQVATSMEERILIFDTVGCCLMALVLLFSPETASILPHKAVATAKFFGLWPILDFALHVKICGSNFVTNLFTALSVVAVVLAPFIFIDKGQVAL